MATSRKDVGDVNLALDFQGKDLSELRRHIHADAVDRHTIRKLLQRVFVPCKCVKRDTPELKPAAEENPEGGGGCDSEKEKAVTKDSCPGHEVAFSVAETVTALDIPEENITTLLCYLELHPKKFLSLLPPAYTMCKVQSYKGMKHVRSVATKVRRNQF